MLQTLGHSELNSLGTSVRQSLVQPVRLYREVGAPRKTHAGRQDGVSIVSQQDARSRNDRYPHRMHSINEVTKVGNDLLSCFLMRWLPRLRQLLENVGSGFAPLPLVRFYNIRFLL